MQDATGFRREQIGDLDRADLGDTAQIITQQIGDHRVFGVVLFVSGESCAPGRIFGNGMTALARVLHQAGVLNVVPRLATNDSGERERIQCASVLSRAP